MTRLLIYDDRGSENNRDQLAPIHDLRGSFELRTGGLRTMDRIARQLNMPIHAVTLYATADDQKLPALIAQNHPSTWIDSGVLPQWIESTDEEVIVVNGRCISIPPQCLENLDQPVSDGQVVLCGRCSARYAAQLARSAFRYKSTTACPNYPALRVIHRPWDLIAHRDALISEDVEYHYSHLPFVAVDYEIEPTLQIIGSHQVRIASSAVLDPYIVIDARQGAVVIESGAQIGSFSVISGPSVIGEDSIILSNTLIRPCCSFGPKCKIAGEIRGSIVQGYSNKSHAGYLGDSYLGEWVNLGADTQTSNMKNTYNAVKMKHAPTGDMLETGLTFLGAILGDHVKTGITTRLHAGTCIGTAAMYAASPIAPKYLEPFSFVTEQSTKLYDIDRFIEMTHRAMARRDETCPDAMIERFHELHDNFNLYVKSA